MLEKVCETGMFKRIVDLAHAHDQRGRGFVELGIRYKNDTQAVLEHEATELGLVGRGDDAGREVGRARYIRGVDTGGEERP